jgi:hypothetical protein
MYFSFFWASRLLLLAKSKFCWKDLDDLLDAGSSLLREIHVDKIFIVEPLQGDRLSVPIRFVTSFEVCPTGCHSTTHDFLTQRLQDIHHVVQLACHGTVGAEYIEGRRYQLDDAATNVPVNPERFNGACLKDGSTFEVSMKVIQAGGTGLNDCPRCGFCHSEGQVDVWIRWWAH